MHRFERVMVVVIDGVRADAIPLFQLPYLQHLVATGASTLQATTVTPSVTAAAMGSLFTGVVPADHGLDSDRFCVPRPRRPLEPLPRLLASAGVPLRCFLAALPRAYRPLARSLARMAGVEEATFQGETADAIADAARLSVRSRRPGVTFVHLPDADRAGHAAGWMSAHYRAAATRVDAAVEALDRDGAYSQDAAALLVVCADHGGGGLVSRNHDSTHPHDVRIPLILSSRAVGGGDLGGDCSLLDVPATLLDAFGVPVPQGWAGRSLLPIALPAAEAAA